ncbi:serine/threonine-protein kinase [Trinickia mobilis]|uniref:serine/threonine-protein kinase n=1 Tax=Trinickia mobilis TaxID=2816356 RepID=UPI001A8CB3C8|nr:serine/threonine-protein kinase [Trinickia mobilis]
MTSLAQLIQTFQSGALSHDAFFDEIDRALAADHANGVRLRDVLDETQTKKPLPGEVYAEVVRHIERFSAGSDAALADRASDETRVVAPAPPNPRPGAPAFPNSQSNRDADYVKGIGDTLNGRFVLEECLGVGGMGTVYKALDLRKLEASDRMPYIAIKVLNVQFRGQPTSLIALQREARKAQTLAHRNIVTVYDFDRDGPMVYLTMEYLSGKPLSKTLRAPDFAGMPYEKALPIINGMGRALAYAHERGFVHCDFKPANVFITDGGEVKVIDFGIARVFQRPDEDTDVTIFDPASLGGITPAYASPEMFEHREPDPRDDVYALACVTYELLTGHHPFNRLSATQAKSEKRQPERPKHLERRQWKTLGEALSFDRASRTPSVARFLEGMGTEKRAALPSISSAPLRIPRKGLAIGGGAVAVLAALWFGYRQLSAPGGGGAQQSGTVAPTPRNAEPQALSLAAVTPVLDGLPCSALSASVEGHTLKVRGFVEARVGRAQVRDALNGVPGLAALNLDVQPVGAHNCDIVKAFAPYWSADHPAADAAPANAATIHTRAPNGQLNEGDPLVVDITTPGFDSYVYVDYYVLDGSVAHLVPSRREKDNQAPPNYSATIGSAGDWVIAKPFGTEMIVLLITPAPLFDALRPDAEPRADYLSAVDQRLKQLAAKYGAARVAVDFIQITTHAGKH